MMPDPSMDERPVADGAADEPNPSAAEQDGPAQSSVSAFERILARATDPSAGSGQALGVRDLAEQHDRYLYSVPAGFANLLSEPLASP